MERFVCSRLRMLDYLMNKGFHPYGTEPSKKTPKHTVFLFEETPELKAAVIRYFSTDYRTAQLKHSKEKNNDKTSNEQSDQQNP